MHKTLARTLIALSLPATLIGCSSADEQPTIAAVVPLTGEGAEYGVAVRDGMELAASQLAREAGATAPRLEVVDSGGDPQQAAGEVERLFEDGAVAAIAGVTDSEALVVARVADEAHRVVISPSAASPDLSGASRWFFRVRPSAVHDGNRMALHAARELKVERVAILAPAGAPAGAAAAFETAFAAQGGDVVEHVEYEPHGDLAAPARAAAKARPQAVYVDGPGPAVRELVSGLRAARFRGRILTHSGFAVPSVLEAAGRGADGVLVSQPIFDPGAGEPAVRAFATAFEERHGRRPGLFEAYGYDAVMTLAAALRQGTLPEAIWKGLHGLDDYRGASGSIQFDERGDVRGFPRVYEVKRGQLAALSPAGGTGQSRLASLRGGSASRVGG
jgi:branched-chain amino acid transport system substrate-binding protein